MYTKTINSTIRRKIIQAKNYYNLLEEHQDKFQLPIKKINGVYNHYWVFGIVLKREGIRDNLINYLDENGIETRPFFYPLHKQPLLGGKYENLEYKNSDKINFSVKISRRKKYLNLKFGKNRFFEVWSLGQPGHIIQNPKLFEQMLPNQESRFCGKIRRRSLSLKGNESSYTLRNLHHK